MVQSLTDKRQILKKNQKEFVFLETSCEVIVIINNSNNVINWFTICRALIFGDLPFNSLFATLIHWRLTSLLISVGRVATNINDITVKFMWQYSDSSLVEFHVVETCMYVNFFLCRCTKVALTSSPISAGIEPTGKYDASVSSLLWPQNYMFLPRHGNLSGE